MMDIIAIIPVTVLAIAWAAPIQEKLELKMENKVGSIVCSVIITLFLIRTTGLVGYDIGYDKGYDKKPAQTQQVSSEQWNKIYSEGHSAGYALGYADAQEAEVPQEAGYIASAHSNKFHYPNCRYVNQISEDNIVAYSSRDDAITDGKEPCSVCQP